MRNTEKYGFALPEPSDYADIEQLNSNTQAIENELSKLDTGKADLSEDGKIPADQLPPMNYDPAGAAQVVQGNLQTHMADKDNPHGVTAEQVGAIPVNGNIDCGAWT